LTASGAVLILSTVPDAAEAERLSRVLIEEGLAACVSRIPGMESVYRWQGAVENSTEVLLLIKTHSGRADSIIRRLEELHSYDVPEILVFPVAGGASSYLAWIRDTVDGGSS
jgi:periplasmic divalent cation tolerance protein